MSRRDARRHAFHLIFQMPFHTDYDAETLAEAYTDYMSDLEGDARPVGRDDAYIIRVAAGVLDKCETLDETITRYLKDWRLERIGRADLAVLRLGVYELLYEPETPPGAVVNEAVELAKQYGADESPAFINGVLGCVAREEVPGVRASSEGGA